MTIRVEFLIEEWADRSLGLPTYETTGAAGADLKANLPADVRSNGITVLPGATELIPTGLRPGIPAGHEIQLRPRSGLALKHGITLLNAPGTIDSDYRGPLGVILINHGVAPYLVAHGDRIAQLIVAPVLKAEFATVEVLAETERGEKGFGSTGIGKAKG